MQNKNQQATEAELQSLQNELQQIRQEVNQLRSMAEQLGLQESQNYTQLNARSNKPADLNQIETGEQQASILLRELQGLCDRMNQHIATISNQIEGAAGYQPSQTQPNPAQQPPLQPAPMINGGLPLGQTLNNNSNESRPDTQYVKYPFDRSTT